MLRLRTETHGRRRAKAAEGDRPNGAALLVTGRLSPAVSAAARRTHLGVGLVALEALDVARDPAGDALGLREHAVRRGDLGVVSWGEGGGSGWGAGVGLGLGQA